MPEIKVYRKWTEWETDGNGDSVGDEPKTVKEREETFDCAPDDIDREEGLTSVELAVKILKGKLYVTETSNYPWSPGDWYSACWDEDWNEGGAHEDLTAHLNGFTPEEEGKIFEAMKKLVPSMR